MDPRPLVGVSLMVVRDTRCLLGLRQGSHGAGEWAPPGGHVENGDSLEGAARRELCEEVGAQFTVTEPRVLCITNLRHYAPKHYVDVGMVALWRGGEPHVMEPEKVKQWAWWEMNVLPSPLFATVANYVTALTTGTLVFEA